MKTRIIRMAFFVIICCNVHFIFAQEYKPSSPINPDTLYYPVKAGLYTGSNLYLSPSVITNKPQTATKEVQQSLLNGLDGLGYGPAFNLGLIIKYPLSEEFNIGAAAEYSNWSSNNTCNCDTESYLSKNSLFMIHFAVLSQYFLYEKLYAAGEISFNIFGAKATENSKRGDVSFSKSYSRIGLGIGLGYEIPILGKLALDISAKGSLPNLILGAENAGNSESIINAIGETKEASLFMLSLNIGLLFSL